jgi:CBS-domain-containing membrane protein
MFYIYTDTGRTFSGPLEQLRRVEKTNATSPTQSVTNSGDEDTAIIDKHTQKNYIASKNATQEYLKQLEDDNQRESVRHAYQVMTDNVECGLSEWTVLKAEEHFRKIRYQVLPIINTKRQLIGTLARRQLYEFLLDNRKNVAALKKTINECFITNGAEVYCANPVTDIRRIATLLIEKNLDALCIVEENGELVGIVSRTDILKCTITDPPLSLWC